MSITLEQIVEQFGLNEMQRSLLEGAIPELAKLITLIQYDKGRVFTLPPSIVDRFLSTTLEVGMLYPSKVKIGITLKWVAEADSRR